MRFCLGNEYFLLVGEEVVGFCRCIAILFSGLDIMISGFVLFYRFMIWSILFGFGVLGGCLCLRGEFCGLVMRVRFVLDVRGYRVFFYYT